MKFLNWMTGGCHAVPKYPETKADVDRVEEACRAMNQKEAIEKAFDSID